MNSSRYGMTDGRILMVSLLTDGSQIKPNQQTQPNASFLDLIAFNYDMISPDPLPHFIPSHPMPCHSIQFT